MGWVTRWSICVSRLQFGLFSSMSQSRSHVSPILPAKDRISPRERPTLTPLEWDSPPEDIKPLSCQGRLLRSPFTESACRVLHNSDDMQISTQSVVPGQQPRDYPCLRSRIPQYTSPSPAARSRGSVTTWHTAASIVLLVNPIDRLVTSSWQSKAEAPLRAPAP